MRRTSKTDLFLLLLLAGLAFLSEVPLLVSLRSEESPPLRAFHYPAMGTQFTIQVYAYPEEPVEPVIAAAWQEVQYLEQSFSDYDPESELMRFCRAAPGTIHPLSPDLHAILFQSLRIHHLTEGAFDPTLRPLQRLWKQTRRDGRLPKEESLAKARA
ncbi:MAG: FAD:protein FMN transferase, partial [Verrucomicrobiota bacterium]